MSNYSNKLTKEEISKVLECCGGMSPNCTDCPLTDDPGCLATCIENVKRFLPDKFPVSQDGEVRGSCGAMGSVGVIPVSQGDVEGFEEFVWNITVSYLQHVGTRDRDSYLLQDIDTVSKDIARAAALYLGQEGFVNSQGYCGPKNSVVKRDYLLYIRMGDGKLRVLRCRTDSLYRVIGKIYSTSLEKIDRIDYNDYLPEREKFWTDEGYTIQEYHEPILGRD